MTGMTSWGGPPYPHCECGHDRMEHIGHAPAELRNDSRLSARVREGGCSAIVGSGWCKCVVYRSVFDRPPGMLDPHGLRL